MTVPAMFADGSNRAPPAPQRTRSEGHSWILAAAGPFLDESGSPSGSLLIIEAASASEAHATAEKDPYALAGLFQSVDIQQWKKAFWQPET